MEITKRDYFAAQALIGLLAHSGGKGDSLGSYAAMAADAYLYADAMLKLSKTLMDPVEVDPVLLDKEIIPSTEGEQIIKP